MNRCYISGFVYSDVEFSFTLRKNPISIAKFKLRLSNNSIIDIYALNEMADYCYRKLKKGKFVLIEGKLNTNIFYKVIIDDINVFKDNSRFIFKKGMI